MSLPLAGARILAADLATVFPVGVDAWQSFTPSVTQSNAVSVTVNQAMYMKIGRLVVANYYLTCTGTGTAGQRVIIGLPVASATAGLAACGSGMIFDASATAFWSGTAIVDTATTFRFSGYNVGNYLGTAGFTAALASGDIISAFVSYQADS
jgi:hypothetical protein